MKTILLGQNILTLRVTFFLLLGLLLCQMTLVIASAVPVEGSTTTLESDAERMISYRHQERMWQTNDGAIHVLINQGSLSQNNASLQLYSSFDNGQSWIAAAHLDNTDEFSTADGVLIENNLGLAYPDVGGKILFSSLSYDSILQTWLLNKTEVVFASDESTAFNPAITVDAKGTIWCAFVNRNNVSQNTNIKLAQQQLTKAWKDTGLIFGMTDNFTQYGERSARPVVTSNGVGMVYTVNENIFWAYRLNTWPLTYPWAEQLLYTFTLPYNTDPYNSHFSIMADNAKNLHMAYVDKGDLKYLRFVNKTKTWDTARTLLKNIKATYPQVTIAPENRLAIFINNFSSISVLQSTNVGKTFTLTNTLTHKTLPLDLDYTNPRIETPGRSPNPIPVFQQFVDGATQRLMYFAVDIIPASK